jgi:hypothetical protein
MFANNNSISLNQTTAISEPYPTLDQLLTMIGSTHYIDGLFLYMFVPTNTIGVIFNLLALIVLQDKEFSIRLYDFLRVYCTNSLILNLFTLFVFVCNTSRIFDWSNTGGAYEFVIYAIIPINSLCYFFGTSLDILISLDRIGTFKKSVDKWMKLSAYKMSLILLACCLVIDFPYFFEFAPYKLEVNLNATFVQTLWYGGVSGYASSTLGTVLNIIIFAIRDVLVVIAEIVLSVASVYFLKEYMKSKSKLLNKKTAITATLVRTEALTLEKKVTTNTNAPPVIAQAVVEQASKERVSNPDQKLSVMVLIMCLLSILEHVSVVAACLYLYFGSSQLVFRTIYFCSWESMALKHALNLPIFLVFNNKFRSICRKFF